MPHLTQPIALNIHYAVTALAWSLDGNVLAIGDEAGRLFFLDIVTGQMLKSVIAHRLRVCALDWSKSGNRLLSSGRDGRIRIWDGLSLEPVAECNPGAPWAELARWSPDGNQFITASDRQVRLWDKRANLIEQWIDFDNPVRALAWQPDSQRAAAACSGLVRVITPRAEGPSGIENLTVTRRSFISLAFSPDSHWLVAGTQGEETHAWHRASHEANAAEHVDLRVMSFIHPIHTLFFVAEKAVMVSVSGPYARLWRFASDSLPASLPAEPCGLLTHEIPLRDAVYVPSRKSLLTITKAGHLTEWASEDWSSQPMASRQALTLLPETEIVRLAPEHDNLALANAEGQVLVWPMNLAFETAPDFGLTRVDV